MREAKLVDRRGDMRRVITEGGEPSFAIARYGTIEKYRIGFKLGKNLELNDEK